MSEEMENIVIVLSGPQAEIVQEALNDMSNKITDIKTSGPTAGFVQRAASNELDLLVKIGSQIGLALNATPHLNAPWEARVLMEFSWERYEIWTDILRFLVDDMPMDNPEKKLAVDWIRESILVPLENASEEELIAGVVVKGE